MNISNIGMKIEQSLTSLRLDSTTKVPQPHEKDQSSSVTISEDALRLYNKDTLKNVPTHEHIDLTDKEYDAMSFDELMSIVDNDAGRPETSSGEYIHITHRGSTEVHAKVRERIAEQTMEADKAVKTLDSALTEFKSEVIDRYSNLKEGSFDISIKDGEPVITSNRLSDQVIEDIQSMLDNSSNGSGLRVHNSIQGYNESAVELINMMIKEESFERRVADTEGNALYFRSEPVTQSEFASGISYSTVTKEGSSYLAQVHQDFVGTTRYGGAVSYLSDR